MFTTEIRRYEKLRLIGFVFILLFLNCGIEKKKTSLHFENTNFEKFSNQKVLIRKVEFPYSYVREIMEVTFKTNLKVELEKGDFFQSVDYYHEPLDKETLIMDLKFNKYYEENSVHPLYFPGAFLTFTLYIWFGGPIRQNQVDNEVIISIYNQKGQLVSQTSKALKYIENENFYSIFQTYKDKRSEFIFNSIREVFLK